MNKRGFVASAILYVMLGLFISLMISIILLYSNRKIMLDKMEKMVTEKLEQDNKTDHRLGDRNEYYEAAKAYMKINTDYSNFNKDGDVSFIYVNSLINEGLLPKDIVSPLTNRKEITQNNYVVVTVDGDNYNFNYVDNATAKDYISVMNKVNERLDALEAASGTSDTVLNQAYPIGSIYITTSYSTAASVANVLGGTWEAYGSGRTLVGVNTSDTNFNTVSKTGGSSSQSITLGTSNLPAHTHSIPELSGTAASAGSHNHNLSIWVYNGSNSSGGMNRYGIGYQPTGQRETVTAVDTGKEVAWGIYSGGAHTHSVTTKASTSGSTGSTTAFSVSHLQPYITVYMYKRTA